MAEKLCELKKKGGGGGELKETTLWTNSRPTSSFPSQNITLPDITPYKLIKATFRISTSNSTEYYELYTPDQLLNGVITGPNRGQVPTLSYHSGTGRYLKYFNAPSTTLETSLGNKVNTSDIANNLTTTTAGKVLDATQGKALNDSISTTNTAITNKHKLTRKTVNTSSWTADTTSQSGSTLYKKSISLSHVYVDSPSVDIATSTGSGLPTTAQQEAFDLLQYVTVDGTTMYLYAADIPSTTFYIGIEGVA